jgi:anti-sigma B factor antagonist
MERVTHRVVLSGELDMATAPELLRELATLDSAAFTIDLSGLTFIDSSGIAALVRLRRDHRTVRIDGVSDPVRNVLKLSGTEGLLFDEAD